MSDWKPNGGKEEDDNREDATYIVFTEYRCGPKGWSWSCLG